MVTLWLTSAWENQGRQALGQATEEKFAPFVNLKNDLFAIMKQL